MLFKKSLDRKYKFTLNLVILFIDLLEQSLI